MNSPDGPTELILPKFSMLPDLPEGPSLQVVTNSEKFQKEKESECAIMILEMARDYLP